LLYFKVHRALIYHLVSNICGFKNNLLTKFIINLTIINNYILLLSQLFYQKNMSKSVKIYLLKRFDHEGQTPNMTTL